MRISDWSSDVCSSDLNCRHFLASLRLYALDEIGASLLVEERIFPVVSRPHSASSGIDQFMRAANNRSRCQFGQAVLSPSQYIRTKAGTTRGGRTIFRQIYSGC